MQGYPATTNPSRSERIEDILDQIEEYDAWLDNWESAESGDEAD